jgi:ABC-type dipeptide/oligopeptide/nickel transport system permease component
MRNILSFINQILSFLIGLIGGPSMLKFLFRRLLAALPVLFAVMLVTFGLSQALPGGPFDTVNQRPMPDHVRSQLEQRYGLNKPVFFNTADDISDPESIWGKQVAQKGGNVPYPPGVALDHLRLSMSDLSNTFSTGRVGVRSVSEHFDFFSSDIRNLRVPTRQFEVIRSGEYQAIEELDNIAGAEDISTGVSVYREYPLYRWDEELGTYIQFDLKPYEEWAASEDNRTATVEIGNSTRAIASAFSGLPTSTLLVANHINVSPSMNHTVTRLQNFELDCRPYRNLPGWSIVAQRDKCKTVGGTTNTIFNEKETVWQIDLMDTQFWGYMWNVLQLDFGPSLNIALLQENVQVIDEIEERLPVSMQIGLVSVAFGFLFGVPLGVLAAIYHNSPIDYTATFVAVLGQSIPNIVLGPILIIVFTVRMDLVPDPNPLAWKEGTFLSRFADPGFWGILILPVIALGTGMSAGIARLTRASLLQVMNEDYIRTARAKGLRERTVIYLHALKNSLIPVATILGPLLAAVLTGTFIVELIFLIPGLGDAFLTGVSSRDYTTIMGVTILYSSFLIAGNILVDIVYTWLDPRIRFD